MGELLKEKEYSETDDELLIQQAYDALINDYLNSNHRKKVEIIQRAFDFAKKAHTGVRRRSGEPYILHPIAVARIVCSEIGLGSTSISAALLHDVVEDTEYTVEDIENLFGKSIATIVDGLTKISSGMFGEDVSLQAENFRKLLLTMSNDIRVILIKIADRLHNMRTLGSMAPAKQFKISGETMYIYAPLAHRLGLFAIKTELEELSFKWENRDVYDEISKKLAETSTSRQNIYEAFSTPVIHELDKMGFKYEIKARDKSIFSIWNKMKTKGVSFEEIYDLFAIRIIFDSENGLDEKRRCWEIYTVITDMYKLKPDRIRDWVSRPKANGYQALHLTVMGPFGKWIEVQIRSRKMNDIAEKGFAAHWKYKGDDIEEDTELNKWLKTIQEILENPSPNALDFLDTIKLNLFAQEIFVFTPKGELKTLAQGATVLDFAYNIHSKVGEHAIGAKVNHKLVPISYKLNSGDQVEVITSKNVEPKAEWLDFVSTAKARNLIDQSLRKYNKQAITQGQEALENILSTVDVDLSEDTLNTILEYFQIENKDELFRKIGNGEIKLPERVGRILQGKKNRQSNIFMRYVKQAFSSTKKEKSSTDTINYAKINPKKTYTLTENSFKENFHIALCCQPIPGDNVFGFVHPNNEVDVHDINCKEGLKLKASHGDKIVNLEWSDAKFPFLTSIHILGIDRTGMLKEISILLNDGYHNVKTIMINSDKGVFDGFFGLYVNEIQDVNVLLKNLRKIEAATPAYRNQVNTAE